VWNQTDVSEGKRASPLEGRGIRIDVTIVSSGQMGYTNNLG